MSSTLIHSLAIDDSGLVAHGSLMGVVAVLTADPNAAITHDDLYALAVTALALSARVGGLEVELETALSELVDSQLDAVAFGNAAA